MTTLDYYTNKKYLTLSDLQNSEHWPLLQPYCSSGINQPRQLLYHYTNKLSQAPACKCGTTLTWNSDKRAYRKFCSKKCTATYTSEQVKETCLQKYGVEHYSQTAEFVEQIKRTSLQKYGVEHYSQTAEFASRTSETNIKKFGVSVASKSQTVKEKVKKHFVSKYGVENPMQDQSVRDTLSSNNVSRFGVPNPAQLHYTTEAISLLSNAELLTQLCSTTPIRTIASQFNLSVTPLYAAVRKFDIKLPKFNQSSFENEVYNFVSTYVSDISRNDKTVLGGKEIDLLLPNQKLAIECNGTYWHSELNGRNKMFHLTKTKLAKSAGLTLIHVWEHNWNQQQGIVKSMLLSRLGLSHKVGARKCQLKEITKDIAKQFFDSSHLQGDSHQSLVIYGLYFQDELVCAMSFSKNRFGNTESWELLRFANKVYYNVIGGASRLFKQFLKDVKPLEVVSYCNLEHSTGAMYEKLGFVKSHTSQPNYFYTVDYQRLHSRNKFQKHKLKKLLPVFDPNLTEWENMKENGYDRIWDCGNIVFKKNSNT